MNDETSKKIDLFSNEYEYIITEESLIGRGNRNFGVYRFEIQIIEKNTKEIIETKIMAGKIFKKKYNEIKKFKWLKFLFDLESNSTYSKFEDLNSQEWKYKKLKDLGLINYEVKKFDQKIHSVTLNLITLKDIDIDDILFMEDFSVNNTIVSINNGPSLNVDYLNSLDKFMFRHIMNKILDDLLKLLKNSLMTSHLDLWIILLNKKTKQIEIKLVDVDCVNSINIVDIDYSFKKNFQKNTLKGLKNEYINIIFEILKNEKFDHLYNYLKLVEK